MLKKIFSIIIFSSVIFLIPILSPKALSIPNIQGLYNTINNYVGSSSYYTGPKMCKNGTLVVYDGTNYYAFCTYSTNNFGASSNIPSVDNNYLNRDSNYYGLTDLYYFISGQQIKRYPGYRFDYDSVNDTWSYACSTQVQPACPITNSLSLNSNSVILGFLDFFPNLTTTFDSFYLNFNENVTLFNKDYNIENYISVLNNWQGNYSGYFTSPDFVFGSHNSFDSEDLTSTLIENGLYSYYNNYMYTINDIDSEYALLGASFVYGYYSDNNYKLGFVLTYRKETDTPPLVYAKTNIGIYSCSSVSSVKSKNDITYQWYVECPSVAFSNDENEGYLSIMVQGAYNTDSIVGPRVIYDLNSLFYTDAGVVGISPIVRAVTSTPPTPIEPGGGTNVDNVIDSIDNINTTITDESLPNTNVLSNSAGWLPPGPVDSIINMPLSLFNGLLNIFSSNATCQPINVPIPYLNNKYLQLPCFNTLISSMGLSVWFEGIGAIASAYILYHYLVYLYAWVDKTLTFRENNWQDWGGI